MPRTTRLAIGHAGGAPCGEAVRCGWGRRFRHRASLRKSIVMGIDSGEQPFSWQSGYPRKSALMPNSALRGPVKKGFRDTATTSMIVAVGFWFVVLLGTVVLRVFDLHR
jgi:hypothetical protein